MDESKYVGHGLISVCHTYHSDSIGVWLKIVYSYLFVIFAQDTFILIQNHPCKIQLRSSKMQKYD